VHVINNITKPLTLAQTVHQVNWETPLPEDVKTLWQHVTKEEESNWANNNAINAETAQLDKYL
jgi:hypothetical protein